MKILEKIDLNLQKFQGIEHLMNDFHRILDSKKQKKLVRLDQNWWKFWKISRKLSGVFVQRINRKLSLTSFLHKYYYIDFCLISESISIEENTIFMQQYFRVREGATFWCSPSRGYCSLERYKYCGLTTGIISSWEAH